MYKNRLVHALGLLACSGLLLTACGDEVQPTPQLNVEIFGWGPTEAGPTGFVMGMPAFAGAETVRLKMTQPLDKRVLTSKAFAFASKSASLPNTVFGENLRMDMEVLDANQAILATGSTSMFDFDSDVSWRTYRMMVAPVNNFAPVGSIVQDRETGLNKPVQSRFDNSGPSAEERVWLGRVGHVAVPTQTGKVLLVGGGDPVLFPQPGTVPPMRRVFSDVQIFDPATGYFTDLAHDDEARATDKRGIDYLSDGRAYHTVTPLGGDRFLVVGGVTMRNNALRAVSSIEVIDLKAPAGTRIQQIHNTTGEALALRTPRAFHTATFRATDRHVVIAGGVGLDNVLSTSYEVLDIANGMGGSSQSLQTPRAEHSAVLAADGQSIWLLGGRNDDGALASTEVLRLQDGATTAEPGLASLNQARFGASIVPIGETGGHDFVIIGGFTGLAGGVTRSYEIGGPHRDRLFSENGWRIEHARGGAMAVELPNSGDVLVLGGLDQDGNVVAAAERLQFDGLGAQPSPYSVNANMGNLYERRYGAEGLLMSNGMILLSGGMEKDGSTALDTAEVYNPLDPVRQISQQ